MYQRKLALLRRRDTAENTSDRLPPRVTSVHPPQSALLAGEGLEPVPTDQRNRTTANLHGSSSNRLDKRMWN